MLASSLAKIVSLQELVWGCGFSWLPGFLSKETGMPFGRMVPRPLAQEIICLIPSHRKALLQQGVWVSEMPGRV